MTRFFIYYFYAQVIPAVHKWLKAGRVSLENSMVMTGWKYNLPVLSHMVRTRVLSQ